jgi:PBP1b-binding outer membrane lipoprotein LpoB
MFNLFRSVSALLILVFVFSACGNKPATDTTAATTTATTTSTTTTTTTTAPAADPLEAFLTEFKAAAAAKDSKKIMDLCFFPLESGQKQSDFIDEIDMYFDDAARTAIAALTAKDLTDEEGNKKISLNFSSGEGDAKTESMLMFKVAKKGDAYKIIAINMAG